MHLRIGVHVGDVMEAKGDVFGNVVNVASRIQSVSEEDGICLTRQVHDLVHDKIGLPLVGLGPKTLKGVGEPVEVFAVVLPWSNLHSAGILEATSKDLVEKMMGGEFPERSAILVVGPPGVGKEYLGYRFIKNGLDQGDFLVYVTRRSVEEVLRDARGYEIGILQDKIQWIAADGGQFKCDLDNLPAFESVLAGILGLGIGRKMRIVVDPLSTLLLLHTPDKVYKLVADLMDGIKQRDFIVLASLEEGMHDQKTLITMQHVFDGVIEMKLYENGSKVLPLIRITKMRGMPPQPDYFSFSITKSGVQSLEYVK